jgi:hypothetical protein
MEVIESVMYTISHGSLGGDIQSRTVSNEKDITAECVLIEEKFNPEFISVTEMITKSWYYKNEGGNVNEQDRARH